MTNQHVQSVMETESPKRKLCFTMQALLWAAVYLTMFVFYVFRWKNRCELDEAVCDTVWYQREFNLCDKIDNEFYNNMMYDGPFLEKDLPEVSQLNTEIYSWDSELVNKGSRFSIVYTLCGITFIMLALSNLCLAAGAYKR